MGWARGSLRSSHPPPPHPPKKTQAQSTSRGWLYKQLQRTPSLYVYKLESGLWMDYERGSSAQIRCHAWGIVTVTLVCVCVCVCVCVRTCNFPSVEVYFLRYVIHAIKLRALPRTSGNCKAGTSVTVGYLLSLRFTCVWQSHGHLQITYNRQGVRCVLFLLLGAACSAVKVLTAVSINALTAQS